MSGDLYSALTRVQHACNSMQQAWLEGEPRPGNDVSLFRALRELHRVLGSIENEKFDDRRLVRALLFHGLSEYMSWMEVPSGE